MDNLGELQRKNEARNRKLIHEHKQENPAMVREAAFQRIADYQEMTTILVEKLLSWPEGTVERKILQNQLDKLASAIVRERASLRVRKENEVTPEMVEQAKRYPIDSLIPGKGLRLCLWHDEKTPSMSVNLKHNRVRCFGSCSRSWDTIDVYQKLNGCSFHDAVRALQ